MKRAPFIFLGIFCALAFSWTGIVLTNQLGYGSVTPHFDETEGKAFPEQIPGVVAQGKLVYQDLGCVQCHTQQVRRPGFGSDVPAVEGGPSRGWGTRQSVARDYIRESRVLIGQSRIGPDLRNVAVRKPAEGAAYDAQWHYLHLYDPQLKAPGSIMPRHAFLFETRQIVGQPSPKALVLPAQYAAPAGHEVVPTARAEALVTYLLSLKDTYAYPETKNVFTPEKKDEKKPTAESHEGAKEGHKS